MFTSNQPLVSIVIPTYNGLPYLEAAIESVLAQDYPHVELIVLDDGSRDDTADFLKKYHGKFYYESHANIGQARTLNKGWEMSKGEIIGYLSADDLLTPDAVRVSVEQFIKNPDIGLTYADFYLIDQYSNNIRKITVPEFNFHEVLLSCSTPIGVAAFFKKIFFNTKGGWNPRYQQIGDLEYQLRIYQENSFVRIPRVLGSHRVHAESASFRKISCSRSNEIRKLMVNTLKNCSDKNVLAIKYKIHSLACLMAGRNHWRSERYKMAMIYFTHAIRHSPKLLISKKTYHILLNAFFNKALLKRLQKFRHLSTRSPLE
jgi:glycosyltransferase involved in cell wall biosynthesis